MIEIVDATVTTCAQLAEDLCVLRRDLDDVKLEVKRAAGALDLLTEYLMNHSDKTFAEFCHKCVKAGLEKATE